MIAAQSTDLERSTFQNRPAYRYIRVADRLPTIGRILSLPLGQVVAPVKLFTSVGRWYIAAYDPDTRMAYGVVTELGPTPELGDFSMAELVDFRGKFGLPIERDLYYRPKSLRDLMEGDR